MKELMNLEFNDTELKDLPLTMAYVPFQRSIDSYEEEQALMRGTLFPDLDKPFYGNLLK